METRPLISIIIPVYNAGDKLNHCIRSLLSQSYQDFEIILVDDKSPDLYTLKLEAEWVEKDRRIKLLKNVINGEHEPRLWGVREAKGSYICFSDQDDWFPKNSLEVMLNAIQKNDVDVVIGQISKVIKVGPFYKEFPEKTNMDLVGKVIEKDELMDHYFYSYFGWNILPVSVWAKLYKRSLFERADKDLEYAASIKVIGGDLMMSMAIHPHIEKLCIIENVVYSYFIGLPGASPKYMKKWLPLASNMFQYKWEMLENYNFGKAKFLLAHEMINYIKTFVRTCSIYDIEHRETHLRALTDALKLPIWEKVRVLKERDDNKAYLVDLILAKDAVTIYEIEEKQIKDAPLALRLKYQLMKKMSRFLS